MSYSMTILLMIMAPLTYWSIWIVYIARMEVKHRRHVESRERQAKLEAFWKEEQLRLNPHAALIDKLPSIEKYHQWGEWDACEQQLAQAERTLSK